MPDGSLAEINPFTDSYKSAIYEKQSVDVMAFLTNQGFVFDNVFGAGLSPDFTLKSMSSIKIAEGLE